MFQLAVFRTKFHRVSVLLFNHESFCLWHFGSLLWKCPLSVSAPNEIASVCYHHWSGGKMLVALVGLFLTQLLSTQAAITPARSSRCHFQWLWQWDKQYFIVQCFKYTRGRAELNVMVFFSTLIWLLRNQTPLCSSAHLSRSMSFFPCTLISPCSQQYYPFTYSTAICPMVKLTVLEGVLLLC